MKLSEIQLLLDNIKKSSKSVRQIAKDLNIPEQRIYGWTNKGAKPGYEDVEKLKRYFSLPITEVSIDDNIKVHDSLFAVVIAEIAALKAEKTGEPVQSIIKRLYKAAENI